MVGDDMRMNLKATELRLGLPGSDRDLDIEDEVSSRVRGSNGMRSSADKAAEVVGWPPIRSFRKHTLQTRKGGDESSDGGIYVKVSMDGAPYLRKIDLRVYTAYKDLLGALESMFKINIGEYSERDGYYGSEYEPTYEDKDGDWMLVGDVPWEMFMSSCSRLRIMRQQSEATR